MSVSMKHEYNKHPEACSDAWAARHFHHKKEPPCRRSILLDGRSYAKCLSGVGMRLRTGLRGCQHNGPYVTVVATVGSARGKRLSPHSLVRQSVSANNGCGRELAA